MNMDVWVTGTSNQLFRRGYYNQIKFSKQKNVIRGKTSFFFIGPFYTPRSICLNIGF